MTVHDDNVKDRLHMYGHKNQAFCVFTERGLVPGALSTNLLKIQLSKLEVLNCTFVGIPISNMLMLKVSVAPRSKLDFNVTQALRDFEP